jgi:A/G-specific adenine glycosylase
MNFNSKLTYWYSTHKRDLPWRTTKNPYNIWLSEIILQQTQIQQGMPYYLKFIEHYPTVFDLAKASEDMVLKDWQGLGYYSRARNLHKTAKFVAKELKGIFPKTYKDLLTLKGVGDYTASAIASICYEEKTAVVDGNVYRVLARFFGIKTPINSTQGIQQFKSVATAQLPKKNIGDYNQAIMEFGARQCKPKSPDCTICPLSKDCLAFNTGTIQTLPVKLKKIKIKKKYFNFLVILSKDQKTILEQRTKKGIWQQLYQFPLIESSKPETSIDWSQNSEYSAFKNLSIDSITLYNKNEIIHKLSHQELHIKFWIIQTSSTLKNGIKWSDVSKYAVPVVIDRFIQKFRTELLFF